MPRQVQMVRGPTSAMGVYTGLQGQLVVDTTLWTIRVCDGLTPGGFVLLSGANNLSDLPNKATARNNLQLGSAALSDTTAFDPAGAAAAAAAGVVASCLQIANNLSDLANKATARTNLGVAIGTDVQGFNARLSALSGLAGGADFLPYSTGATSMAQTAFTAFARTLLDDVDAATMRTTIGCPSLTGGGASGSWGINITGSSASCTGNAATATTAGNITAFTINQNLGTGNSPTFANVTSNGVINCAGEITAFTSDNRLKNRHEDFTNALDAVCSLDVFYYEFNQQGRELGLAEGRHIGLSAQQVKTYLPEASRPAVVDNKYLTYQDHEIIPALVQCIKELRAEIEELKAR